jgi:hypothetical protein
LLKCSNSVELSTSIIAAVAAGDTKKMKELLPMKGKFRVQINAKNQASLVVSRFLCPPVASMALFRKGKQHCI